MKACCAALSLVAAATCWEAASSPSLANDTSAELAIGGLTFTKNADVSMESEDLTITLDTVTVRYTFLNRSTKPVTLTVAFPLPDINLADASNAAFPVGNPLNYVGFSTKIDGKVFEWGPKDVFVIPSWMKYAHNAKKESVLFQISDRPAQEALGIWREKI